MLDPDSGRLTDLDLPYQVFVSGVSAAGQTIATIAGGPAVPTTVIGVEVPAPGGKAQVRELSRSVGSLPDPAYLPVPRAARLTGPSGSVVHAIVYPPANPAVRGPEGERPPYIVWVHGGPTSQVVPRLDLEKAFFTSRGIGDHRRELRRVERVRPGLPRAAARPVGRGGRGRRDDGRAGAGRVGRGGRQAARHPRRFGGRLDRAGRGDVGHRRARRPNGPSVFAAVASYFGVADLRGFAEHTHDFESRYLDGLIGPLPEYDALYAERAPVGHVNDATCPVLLLQGLDDPVVPPAQSESIAADLAAHGIRYAYITFEGESHGFRKAENIVASLEAELSFYGQIMGFTPPGVPPVPLAGRLSQRANSVARDSRTTVMRIWPG